jgi:GT2 family glycosyltransferase/SAM-dependent methyltransferase/Flp pilus assembly protein TadD
MTDTEQAVERINAAYYEFCRERQRPYFGRHMWASQGLPLRHVVMQELVRLQASRRPGCPLRILEVGSWAGGSAITWAEALKRYAGGGEVLCVDPWKPYFKMADRPDVPVYRRMAEALERDTIYDLFLHNVKAAGHADIVTPLRGQSTERLPTLPRGEFDIVFVDGDHSYRAVVADLKAAKELVREGGILCGDDLELQLSEIDETHARTQREADYIRDPRSGKEFHPGVTLAVGELLGTVSSVVGCWAARRMRDQWDAVSMSDIKPMAENIPRHLHQRDPATDPEFRQWISERESFHAAGRQDRTCTGAVPEPSLIGRGERRTKALLIQLDFQTWAMARPWSYCAAYGVQEGLAANGVECVTIPAIAEHPCSSPASWLYHAKTLLSGQRFDQVWVWLVHTPLDEATMEWVSTLAPVRVGVLMESLRYDAEDYVWAPQLKSRRGVLDVQMPYLTHVLAPDEQDAEEINAIGKVRVLWWPAMVPERFVVPSSAAPVQRNAVFHGTPYGRRQNWMAHPLLQQRLQCARADQPPTTNQQLFDQLQGMVAQYLQSGRPVLPQLLLEHAESLQKVRAAEFSEWMRQLQQWPAIVNLPSLAKFYGGRVMEGMAIGRPVISWQVPNHPRNLALFEPDKEILLFNPDDPAVLAEQIDRLRHDPKYAASVARNGQDRVRQYHTAERRLKETLCWLREGVEPRYGTEASQCPSPTSRHESTATAVGSTAHDEFYVDLFVKKPHWSTPEPNADESARWSKIASWLEHIIRETRGQDSCRTLRILDVGCGRGWLTNLASAYGDPEGVEPVAGVIEYARSLFPHLRFTVGTPETILARNDFKPFDIVLCSEVIEHVPHPQKPDFVGHLSRLLTPDGYLILTTPRGEVWEQWRRIAPPNQPVEDWVTESHLGELFRANGFHPLGVERVHVEVPSLRYFPTATRHELQSMSLMPIYQVWACRRDGMPLGGPKHTFPRMPMVSVIVPTFNRSERLRTALHSIAQQSFQDYEIIVVNDAGLPVEAVVKDLNRDGRITLVNHDRNRGLAASRNTGLRHARGRYVCYLDDDDRYLPDHLETLISRLEGSEFRVAYTDAWRVHERLEGGQYVEVGRDLPYSYDFNPASLLVSNYFPVLCVMHERTCLDDIGLFDESLFAHEDWDLWIRMATKYPFKHLARTTAEFTWREDGSSMTSGTRDTYVRTMEIIYRKYRSYAEVVPGLLKVQQNHLSEFQARSRPKRYDCSIIVPVWNKVELTRQCLLALVEATSGATYEVIVVDNGSTDGTQEFLMTLGGDVQVIRNTTNQGFAKACNQGARAAHGKYLVFLNNDTIPQPGWLNALVMEVEGDASVGVVGSKLLFPDGTIQHAGVVRDCQHLLPYHLYKSFAGDHPAVNQRREFQIVTAACLLIRRSLFEEVGGFDEGYVNGFEDADLCLKVKERGSLVVYQPRSVIIHLESQSPGRKAYEDENAARFLHRWGAQWWAGDEDLHFYVDGYKLRRISRNGQLGGDIVLMEDIKDGASWAHVAATQSAALKKDWAAVKRELQLVDEWPSDQFVLSWAAMVAERLQESGSRAKLLSRYVALVDAPAERLALIRMLLEQKNLAGAEEHLRILLMSFPSHAEGLLVKGILCMQQEQYDPAEAAFDSALREGADRKKCLMGMGMAAMGRAYAQGAWERFRQVLEEYPDDGEAVHWLLRAGTGQNRWEELSRHLREYLSRNPADLAIRFALAGVLVRGEQIEAARQEYDMLRVLAPTFDGLSELGHAIAGKQALSAMEAAHSSNDQACHPC